MNKILIADSSVQNTDLMAQCLSSTGYEIYTAESGHNALAKIQLFKPDILIADTGLPDMSGYDLCKRVKADSVTQYVIVLLLSSSESKEYRIRAIEVGADDFMEKTFDAYILITKVNSLLRVKHLSDQLKQKYMELEEKNYILDYQLKMGRQVQRSLLKDINMKFNGVKLISKYMPALDVGGDFYDIIKLNENCLSVVIGDVSGHGISAALLTAMLNMMIKNVTDKYFNPDQVLFYMNNSFNKIFQDSGHEMYACIFYAVINTKDNKIYYSNAGQALPVFVDSTRNIAYELDATGLPIGLMNDSTYEYKSHHYKKGDLLLFLTDGLTDAFYKNNPTEFYQRITELLLDMKSEDDMYEILDSVLNSFYKLNASEAEKYELDDVSLILCKM